MRLDSWWLDLKLGARMLRKFPALALAGGGGIAAAVAIATGSFSLVYDNFLTSSVPLPEGDRLVAIELWDSAAHRPEPRLLYDVRDWTAALRSFSGVGTFRIQSLHLTASPGAEPEGVRVAVVTPSTFRIAGVPPMLGRYLEDRDAAVGAPPVAVIGEQVWRNRYAGDASILGRTVTLGGVPYTIAGVMPRGFAFPVNDHLWIPLVAPDAVQRPLTGPGVQAFARLAPGASVASAQAELNALAQAHMRQHPNLYEHLRPQVMPYAFPFTGVHGTADVGGLLAIQGALLSLLVLVCLNVMILVYTRTALRQAEIGLRMALGASRARIVAQLFLEALLLSAAASAVGVGLAHVALRAIGVATLPLSASLPFWLSFRLSGGAILYAMALALVAAAIVGIVPALQATRKGLYTGFRVAGLDGMRLGRVWTVLIVAQVAFAVALLPPSVSAAWRDSRDSLAGLGFPAAEYLSFEAASDTDDVTFARLQAELLRRLASEPEVRAVTFSSAYPGNEPGLRVEDEEGAQHQVRLNRVDPAFLAAFDVPVLAGRGFGPADATPSSGTVLVNAAFVRDVLHGANALGRTIRFGPGNNPRRYEIVGVVPDFPAGVSQGMKDTAARVYQAAEAGSIRPPLVAIRLLPNSAPAAAFLPRLRQIAQSVHPALELRQVRTLDEVLRSEQWISSVTAAVFLAVTLSVLALSSAGIYALMSFTVSQRRREVGIRMALGADTRQIVASIFSRAFRQLSGGALAGAALAIALDRASQGEAMSGYGAVAIPAVALAMLMVGFLAALGPARRSLRIQPTEALREQ